MGILRFILALAVVVYHSYKILGLRMCGGSVAVQSFYLISGFYMALILNEKYSGKGNYFKFLYSRFLRIFPTYWIVLLIAFLCSIFGYLFLNKPYYLARYISYYDCLSCYHYLWFAIENIVIIGQDVLYFTKFDEWCHLDLVINPLSFKHNGYNYLLVPQAWTVSLELMFYIIAPFIVTKNIKWQLLLLVLAIFFRFVVVNYTQLSFDPWTYRFFPFELMFFLGGSVIYKWYKHLNTIHVNKKIGMILLMILIIVILFYEELSFFGIYKNWIFYTFLLVSIPFVFLSFKDKIWDREIGELSFSIYITHHLLVGLFRPLFFENIKYISYYGYAVVLSSLVLAIIFNYIIIRPLEKYRQKKVQYF